MRLPKLSVMFLVILELCACATPASVLQADAETTRKASQFSTTDDRGKIYFVNGKMIGNIFGLGHKYPADLYVNAQLIGSMNKDDALVFEVRPGEYQFHWNARTTDPIDQKALQQQRLVRVNGGDVVILQGDFDPGGAAMFGLVGALVAPPKTSILPSSRSEVNGKSFVLPQSCPSSICVR